VDIPAALVGWHDDALSLPVSQVLRLRDGKRELRVFAVAGGVRQVVRPINLDEAPMAPVSGPGDCWSSSIDVASGLMAAIPGIDVVTLCASHSSAFAMNPTPKRQHVIVWDDLQKVRNPRCECLPSC
jgi:hypothetical protein